MILRDSIVLLEFSDLVNDACLSKDAYDRACAQKRITVAQRACPGHPALIDWRSLPDRYKAMVRHHLKGDPEHLAKAQVIEQHLLATPADMAYLDSFKAANGLGLTTEARQQMGLACRVVAMLAEAAQVMHEGGTPKVVATYGMSAMQLKAAVIAYVKANRKRLPSGFPTSFARLEAKKRAYLAAQKQGEAGASALIHGGHGNANRGKVVQPERQQLLRVLAARPQNFSRVRIASDYNAVARKQGWPQISPNTVKAFLANGANGRAVTVYAKGVAAYQNTYGVVVHRSRPTQPTYLWVHDATHYELLYQKEVDGKLGYHHRKVVCVVLDPHSWYPVGYAIGDTETVALTKQAVADAVRHIHALTGHYALPRQVQSDNMGRAAFRAWYGTMDVIYTPAKARNARAKVIEPWFGQHNDHYSNRYFNWSGHNVTSRKENQPNPDALNRNRHDFPTEAGVIEQIHEAIGRERADKAEAFRAALLAMPEGELRRMDRTRFLELFGTAHEWTNKLTNRGLCPTLLGEERAYQLLSADFHQHVGLSFQVIYDPADLSNVLAVARDGAVKHLVPAVQQVPMALRDHTPETRAHLAGIERYKADMGQEAIDAILDDQVRVKELANALIVDAALTMAKRRPQPRREEDNIVTVAPEVEATTKAYLTEGGSHKAALHTAMTEAQRRNDIERLAEDQF